jgi:hypothetical protein
VKVVRESKERERGSERASEGEKNFSSSSSSSSSSSLLFPTSHHQPLGQEERAQRLGGLRAGVANDLGHLFFGVVLRGGG